MAPEELIALVNYLEAFPCANDLGLLYPCKRCGADVLKACDAPPRRRDGTYPHHCWPRARLAASARNSVVFHSWLSDLRGWSGRVNRVAKVTVERDIRRSRLFRRLCELGYLQPDGRLWVQPEGTLWTGGLVT